MGKVTEIAGTGNNAQVTIDFGGNIGQKRLLLRYSPVTKL
jgi:DNA helicase-2/ATP-dependent DNA helicase PcrA